MAPIPGMEWDDIKAGTWKTTVVDAEPATSSTGNPMLVIRMLVEQDGKEIPAITNFSLLPQAQFKLRSFLRVLGYGPENDPDPADLEDCEFLGLWGDQNGRITLLDWKRDIDAELEDDEDDEDEDEAEEEPPPAKKAPAKKKSGSRARDF